MLSSIEISKNYSIKLNELYGGSIVNLNIIGITDIDNVSKNENNYNIYDTFFKPNNLGLTTYYSAINKLTKIYICAPIVSLSPFEIDDKNKIFIPESLINMPESSELVPSMTISFNVYPIIIDNIPDDIKRQEYLKSLESKIKNRLRTIIEFSSNDCIVESNYTVEHLIKEDLDNIKKLRNDEYQELLKRQKNIKDNMDLKERQYNVKYSELSIKKDEYNDIIDSYNTEIQKLQEQRNKLEKIYENIKDPNK